MDNSKNEHDNYPTHDIVLIKRGLSPEFVDTQKTTKKHRNSSKNPKNEHDNYPTHDIVLIKRGLSPEFIDTRPPLEFLTLARALASTHEKRPK